MSGPERYEDIFHPEEESNPPPYETLNVQAQQLTNDVEALQPPPFDAEIDAGVTEEGRIEVDLDSKFVRYLSKVIPDPVKSYSSSQPVQNIASGYWKVKLNIVIQVVGSRGDVQPFVALGNELQRYGHRVRLATHNCFAEFVRKHGLEFYSIGGDPEELMAYMVKNPGLIPSIKSLKGGEIQRKRIMVAEMLDGCWKSCIEPDELSKRPFAADAIIANPPSFAHIHCAQALAIPVHLMFTMPWTNTRAFPHPLANLKNVKSDLTTANYVSYTVVEWLTWQGLGDVINNWRKTLDLEPIAATEGPNLASTLKIPFTYCWSPSLVPKPIDWASHIDICGFFFRDAPKYSPPKDLEHFLHAGPPPVYIGFGSIVIEDPAEMTALIVEAVIKSGCRAIISRGWSRLGGPEVEGIFYLGDCPHEWLFQQVAAVIHHGGAGTTACGLLNGRPTGIIPFFGDQPFWGNMVAAAGAGPLPIHHKSLNASNLSQAISFCLTPEASMAAEKISAQMKNESGVRAAVSSFHAGLPLEMLSCDLLPNEAATWTYRHRKKTVRLSKVAAEILSSHSKIERKNLEIFETKPIIIETRYYDPISSMTIASTSTSKDIIESGAGIFYNPVKEYKLSRAKTTSSNGESSTQSDSQSVSSVKIDGPKEHWQKIQPGVQLAGAMTLASSKSLGELALKSVKGVSVDIPLAITEGFHNVPKLYGDQARDHGNVTDLKSGFVKGGKSFMYGMSEGLTDIFVQPYLGAKEDGAVGALKGFGKGTIAMATKTASGAFGLVAYPGQGLSKSIQAAVNRKTRNSIKTARLSEGRYLTEHGDQIDHSAVIKAFEEFVASEL